MELALAKEKMESCYRNEQNRTAHVIEEKGNADMAKPFIINWRCRSLETFYLL